MWACSEVVESTTEQTKNGGRVSMPHESYFAITESSNCVRSCYVAASDSL
jgi:hypothetical protein